MIEELNQLIKKEARKLLKQLIALNVSVFIALGLYLYQVKINTPVIVTMTVLGFLPIIPFITVYIMIVCLVRTVNPHAEKSIEKFCNKTDHPKDTFARLERAWKYGALFQLHEQNTPDTAKALPIRIDKEYLIGIMGFGINVKIIPLKNSVWIYSDKPNKHTKISKKLYVCYADDKHTYIRKKYKIAPLDNVSLIDGILRYISDNLPDIAVVHCKETKTLWDNKDLAGLRAYANKTHSNHVAVQERENKAAGAKSFRYRIVQLLTLLPAFGMILGVKFSANQIVRTGNPTTALKVLEGYETLIRWLCFASIVATVLVVIANVVIIKKLVKSCNFMRSNTYTAVACVGATVLFSLIIASPLNGSRIKKDISAIQNDNLTTEYLYINSDSIRDDLGGISYPTYGVNVVYQTYATKANSRMPFEIYFPEEFHPGTLQALAESDRYQVSRHDPDKRCFIVTFTPHYKMVVDIAPVTAEDLPNHRIL